MLSATLGRFFRGSSFSTQCPAFRSEASAKPSRSLLSRQDRELHTLFAQRTRIAEAAETAMIRLSFPHYSTLPYSPTLVGYKLYCAILCIVSCTARALADPDLGFLNPQSLRPQSPRA